MKTTASVALITLFATGCAGSNSQLSSSVDAARADVNASLGRVQAKARPAVRPVAQRMDRGANQAAAKLGLRHRPGQN
jgi:Tfp pilus assembly protein PilP